MEKTASGREDDSVRFGSELGWQTYVRTYVLPDRRNGGLSVVSGTLAKPESALSLSLTHAHTHTHTHILSFYLLTVEASEGGGREAATNVAAVAIVTEHSHDDEE